MIKGVRYRGALKTARNKVEAEQAEAAVILSIHNGTYGKQKASPKLKDFVEEIFRPLGRGEPAKLERRRGLSAILNYFGNWRLSDLTPFMIEKYKIHRRKTSVQIRNAKSTRERSVASVNRELSLLSRIFSIAIGEKEVQSNPCRDVKPISGEQPRTRYLTHDEEERLWRVLKTRAPYIGAVVKVALHSGMRGGEVVRLKSDQIDFSREVIKATKTKNGTIDLFR